MNHKKFFATILSIKQFFIVAVMITFATSYHLEAQEKLAATKDPIDAYNVVWESPSKDCWGSMPIGNGDIGLNVWVEEDGDLLFYIGKTDAWDSLHRLIKVGRLRVKLSPNPFVKGMPFKQTLRLRQGEIEILAGQEDSEVKLRIWVDANQSVIRIEAEGKKKFDVQVETEIWRQKERPLEGVERWSAYVVPNVFGHGEPPSWMVTVGPDTVYNADNDRVVWFHRDTRSIWEKTLKLQGLESFISQGTDPLINRTFGGLIKGQGLVKENSTTLRSSKPGNNYVISVYLHTSQTDTAEQWVKEIEQLSASVDRESLDESRKNHQQWWQKFWDRSWIRVPEASQLNEPGEIDKSETPMRFGDDHDGRFPDRGFIGDISRVRISKRVLTPEEITAHAEDQIGSAAEDTSCMGDWLFEKEENGIVRNAVGNELPARIGGDAKLADNDGRKCVRLNGQGYIDVIGGPVIPLGPSCTLEAWIAPKVLKGRIIEKCNWDHTDAAGIPYPRRGYFLEINPDESLRMAVEHWVVKSSGKLNLDKWNYVAGTFDIRTGEQKLYVNGELVASAVHEDVKPNVSQGYTLQRYISACAGRGFYPIKFNGSIFNVDSDQSVPVWPDSQMVKAKASGRWADHRSWGGPYWFQNSRLIYWPMLASGDFEMMRPFFRLYGNTLALAKARTLAYFGHEGAFFPETMYIWGTYANSDYSWSREGKHVSEIPNSSVRWYWTGSLELLAMMLDYYAYTKDADFVSNELLPMADELLMFWDKHYLRDEKGCIHIAPAQCLECYYPVTNPTDQVAGLQWVLERLLKLPEKTLGTDRRVRWMKLRKEIPCLPLVQEKGKTIVKASQDRLQETNAWESPELYSVFPFRICSLGKPGIEIARSTYNRRLIRWIGGWYQGDIWAAYLGLTDEARRQIEMVLDRGLMFLGSGLTDPDISLAASLLLYGAHDLQYPAALNGPQFLAGLSILKKPFVAENGHMSLPTGPGLGIEVDEDKLWVHRVKIRL